MLSGYKTTCVSNLISCMDSYYCDNTCNVPTYKTFANHAAHKQALSVKRLLCSLILLLTTVVKSLSLYNVERAELLRVSKRSH